MTREANPVPASDLAAALDVLARALAPAVARAVVDELAAGRPGDHWVDQTTSPLGARRHGRLIREGALPGVQAGRRWLAKREDVYAYLEASSKRARKSAPSDDPSDLARELGLRVVGGRAR